MATAPFLHLHTFGGLELRRPDGTSAGDGAQPKPLALLAFLAVTADRPIHRRDTLVGLFWPELDQAHARAALRKALHHLRDLDPRMIVTRGDEEVRVDLDLLWCDAREFRRLTAAGAHAEALALYAGDFLPGFHVAEAPEFERWIDRERHRLRRLAADGAVTLAESSRASGEPVEAVRWATRALELSPLEERSNRLLIELLDGAGDRPAALAAYAEYCDRLHRDLELNPSPEIAQFVEGLRRYPPVPLPAVEVTTPQPPGNKRGRILSRRLLAAAAFPILAVVALLPRWFRDATVYFPARVVVAPFENRAGEPVFDQLAAQLLAHLPDAIAREGVAEPVPAATVRDLLARTDGSPGDVADWLARETRAGLEFRGVCYRAAGGPTCQVDLFRMPRKVPRMSVKVSGDPSQPAFVAELTERLLVMLFLQQTWGDRVTWQGEYVPRSLAAVKAFRQAGNRQFRQQRAYLAEAARLDTAWVFPAAWATVDSSAAAAESTLARLARRPDLLESQREEIAFAAARRRRQPEQAFQLAWRRFAVNPEWWHYPATYWAEFTGRSETAVAISWYADSLFDIGDQATLPERGPSAQQFTYTMRAFALHHLGRYREQLEQARDFQRRFPADPLLYQTHEAMALAGLGQVETLRRRLAEWEATPEPPGRAWAGSRAYIAGMELLAHGREREGRDVLAATMPLYRRLRAMEPSRLLELIELLLITARLDEAREVALGNLGNLKSLEDSTDVVLYLGIIAEQQGTAAEAARHFEVANRYEGRLVEAGEPAGVTLWRKAVLAGWRGDREGAVRFLEEARAAGGGQTEYRFSHREPAFAGLRDYTPFQRFLKPRG